jgi:hypothetical protein
MRAIALICVLLFPTAAAAQVGRGSDAILTALQTESLLRILQDEAVDAGSQIAETMMPGRAAQGWADTVGRINSPDRTGPILSDRFAESLEGRYSAMILHYLEAPLGQQIVGLELDARKALRDPETQQAVLVHYADMRAARDPRIDLLEDFIRVNNLIDGNVVGALNANAAFLKGLSAGAGGAGGVPASEAEILTQVWQQEPQLRAETEDWVRAYVVLAYQPLSDAEMADYVDFCRSPAGQAMNTALFDAFDALFVSTSFETGEALGRWMNSEDL